MVVLYIHVVLLWYCCVVLLWYCCVVLLCGNAVWYCCVVMVCGIAMWYCCVVMMCGIAVWYCCGNFVWYWLMCGFAVWYSCVVIAVWYCPVVMGKKTTGLFCGIFLWYFPVVFSCGIFLWYFPVVFSMVFPVVQLCGITTGIPHNIFVRSCGNGQKNHRIILWYFPVVFSCGIFLRYFPVVFSMVFPVVQLCGITTGIPHDIFVRDNRGKTRFVLWHARIISTLKTHRDLQYTKGT